MTKTKFDWDRAAQQASEHSAAGELSGLKLGS
jgi:hypothetical protein